MAFQKEGMGQGLSGRLGGVVYRRVGEDTVVCRAPERRDVQSPEQMAQRRRVDRATLLWGGLTPGQRERWGDWAADAGNPLPSPGGARGSRRAGGYAAFRSLALRYLRVHGGADAPSEPPATPFLGDGIEVQVGGAGAEGGLVFAASGPNAVGVVTELLAQPLAAAYRAPKARDYRSLGYVAFDGEAAAFALPPGAYACAVRFVRAGTGQATGLVPIGTVEVTGGGWWNGEVVE